MITLFLPIAYELPPARDPATAAPVPRGLADDRNHRQPGDRVVRIPVDRRDAPGRLYRSDAALKEKVVLIVGDDVRNLLALSALLQRHEVKALTAESGKDALEALARGDCVDIILMDIMMPRMDGYATIRAGRQMPRFKGVPIIALTAKAMKGDREKCLSAGASDYIAQPVDPDQLLSLLHGCLYR
jgi:CheY-like chemotaxis protein